MNKMQYAGTINSEETISGLLPDGRTIYVQILSVPPIPVPTIEQGPDPLYWLGRLERGDFEDEENEPIVWIEPASAEWQAEKEMQALDRTIKAHEAWREAINTPACEERVNPIELEDDEYEQWMQNAAREMVENGPVIVSEWWLGEMAALEETLTDEDKAAYEKWKAESIDPREIEELEQTVHMPAIRVED